MMQKIFNIAFLFVLIALTIGVYSLGMSHQTIQKRLASAEWNVEKLNSQPVAITGQASGPWGLLRQIETDAITQALKGLPAGQVTIFCRLDCQGIVLDFDNAFESAKWQTKIEQPVLDFNEGINVAPDSPDGRALARLLNDATGDRLKIGTLAGTWNEGLAVVVSTRPRR